MLDPAGPPTWPRHIGAVIAAAVIVVLTAVAFQAISDNRDQIRAWFTSDPPELEPDPCAETWEYAADVRPDLDDLETLWHMARDDDGTAGFLLATDDGANAYRWATTVDRNPDCFSPDRQADAALWLRRIGG